MPNARALLLVLLPFCLLLVVVTPADVASRVIPKAVKRKDSIFHGLAFLPDGKSALIGDTQGYLAIWDLAPPRLRVELARGNYDEGAPSSATTITVTPDGRRAFVRGPTSLNVYDLEKTTLIQRFPGGGLASPDGKWVVCAKKAEEGLGIQLHDMRADRAVWSLPLLAGGPMRFSIDSRLLLVPDMHCRAHQVVEVATGRLVSCYRPPEPNFVRTRFSPTGRYAVTNLGQLSGSELRVWEVATSREVLAITIKKHGITDLDFLPDGRLLTAGYTYGEEGRELQDARSELLFWDVGTGTVLRRINGTQFFGSGPKFALSADGRRALVGVDRRVSLWDLETGTGSWVIKSGK